MSIAPLSVLLVRSRPFDLVNTRSPGALTKEIGAVMPLGIAYIAGHLRAKNIAVAMLDAEAEKLSLDEVEQRITALRPRIVGITSMTPTIRADFAIARVAKRHGAIVVVGGPQANAMPLETVAREEVDFVIQGEGEIPLERLILALNGNGRLEDVPGLVDGKSIHNPPFIVPNLDDLALPARDLLPIERYSAIISRGRLATLDMGRGCPFLCGFCFKQPSDIKVRYFSPMRIVDEMEQVVTRFGASEINIVTDTLTVNKKVIKQICEEIIRRDLKVSWIAPTRVDCVTLELLLLMKRAGCRSLRFGVESGSEEILKRMNKKMERQELLNAFRWAREAGIESFAYMIIGYLGETEKTIRESLAFVRELDPDMVMYNTATPLPSTPLFHQAVQAGLVSANYWKDYVAGRTDARIPLLYPDADKWIARAYRQFYFSPRFIARKLRNFRKADIGPSLRALRGLIRL